MILKWLFDRLVSLIGVICLCWLYVIVAILIKVKMPGGPVLFCQKRVGRGGKLFTVHKFRSMTARRETDAFTGVAAAETARITPLGEKLRRYKLDELPELWDVFIGNMSFVGPRPDVPGYADKLQGEDRNILKLRPGITGPASLKYRDEEEMLASLRLSPEGKSVTDWQGKVYDISKSFPLGGDLEEATIWYNDEVIYPDKVRLNLYYYNHYSFWTDIKMIFATVLGKRIVYAGEVI